MKEAEQENKIYTFGDVEDENPFAILKTLYTEATEKEIVEKRKNLIGNYKDLGHSVIIRRLRNKPVDKILKDRDLKLNHIMATELPELRFRCFTAFLAGMGLETDPLSEGVCSPLYGFLEKGMKKESFQTNFINRVRGDQLMVPSAVLFLRTRIDLMDDLNRATRLEEYLLDSEVAPKLRATILLKEHSLKAYESDEVTDDLENVVCITNILEAYSQWVVNE